MNIQDIMLPSEKERCQIFHYLKKISSLTAWQRIFEFYQAWVNVAESSVREADTRGWGKMTSLPYSDYTFLLKSLAHREDGVRRLRLGDKRVFKFDANGEFAMAARATGHYSQLLYRLEIGENRINEEYTPLWSEFSSALLTVSQAWGECGVNILEPRYQDEPALLPYNDWLRTLLKASPFPDVLEPVPDPQDNLLVRTGSLVPCSGIWEPIDAPKPSMIMTLLGKTETPLPPFTLMGCMNYLHGASPAPTICACTKDDEIDLATTWRLLWRDDRYIDGLIPEEERYYRFNQPEVKHSAPQNVSENDQITWTESGTAATKTGRWLVESDMTASIELKAGELLPLHQGRMVRWVMAE
ncbi:Imm71 family immunity protein [Herbaspirillum sp. C7C8]|uniref:Imm71 family immunity protein n=1 Tax=Herbaspirillum sp. C7C8 TaxID=2736665 RepID=UPI001F52B3A5|nr:Imm71 family immunity protein [Herbaspirillum sp. C7C8]